MTQVQILVGQSWEDRLRYLDSRRLHRPADSSFDLGELRDVIDIVVDGRNLTASVPEESIFDFSAQLLEALFHLVDGTQAKAIVDFHHEPWELALVADGDRLLLSLYTIDRRRMVIARDLPANLHAFGEALLSTGEQLLRSLFRISDHFASDPRVRQISHHLAALKQARPFSLPRRPDPDASSSAIEGQTAAAGLTLRYHLDAGDAALMHYEGQPLFDLHALLAKGQLILESGDQCHPIDLPYPFLVMQALLDRCRQLLNQLESNAHAPFRLSDPIDPLPIEVHGQGSRWTCVFGDADQGLAFTQSPSTILDLFLSIAELFVQDLLRLNPRLELNQRFDDFVDEVHKLRKWHGDLCGTNRYLDAPQDYLSAIGNLTPSSAAAAPEVDFPHPLRAVNALFSRRQWSFQASQIDFHSLHLDADGLLVSSTDQLHRLDLNTGIPLWSHDRAQPLNRPGLVADHRWALTADRPDRLQLIDLHSGSVITDIDAPGDWTALAGGAFYREEHLGIAARRDGRLLAFDSRDGQPRWTFQLGPSQLEGIRFEGPLVIIQSSEGVLSALDPLEGSVLWQVRTGGSPHLPLMTHQGRLYVINQDPIHHGSTLFAIYPLTGRTVWQTRLPGFVAGPPTFIDQWMLLAIERQGQLALHSIDLESISPGIEWHLSLSTAGADHPSPVAFTSIDDHPFGLIRTDRAELTCFDLIEGAIRWRSVPDRETLLLHGQLPLFVLRDAVINISDQIDLRHLATGQLLHSLDAIEAPDHALLAPPLSLLLGERAADPSHHDRITSFDLNRFLTLI